MESPGIDKGLFNHKHLCQSINSALPLSPNGKFPIPYCRNISFILLQSIWPPGQPFCATEPANTMPGAIQSPGNAIPKPRIIFFFCSPINSAASPALFCYGAGKYHARRHPKPRKHHPQAPNHFPFLYTNQFCRLTSPFMLRSCQMPGLGSFAPTTHPEKKFSSISNQSSALSDQKSAPRKNKNKSKYFFG